MVHVNPNRWQCSKTIDNLEHDPTQNLLVNNKTEHTAYHINNYNTVRNKEITMTRTPQRRGSRKNTTTLSWNCGYILTVE